MIHKEYSPTTYWELLTAMIQDTINGFAQLTEMRLSPKQITFVRDKKSYLPLILSCAHSLGIMSQRKYSIKLDPAIQLIIDKAPIKLKQVTHEENVN